MKKISANKLRKLKSKVFRPLQTRWSWRNFAVAMGLALLILIVDYYAANLSFPIFDSSITLGNHALIHDSKAKDVIDDSFMMVNTAWDQDCGVVYDVYNEPAGCLSVTDRRKLYEFLKLASEVDYRYIFLDIRFEKNVVTPYDSLLYSQIALMPRVVYSYHRPDDDARIDYVEIPGKYAYADYRVAKGDPFSRYEFLQEGSESVALRLYRDLDGKTINRDKLGTFRNSDGSLCYNMQFIPFPLSAANQYGQQGRIIYPRLGSQLMDIFTPDELKRMMSGKIIVIGNFYEDQQETYIGEVPGPLLSVYAWKLLERGSHKVSFGLQFFLFVFYTLALYIMLLPEDLKKIKNPVVALLLSLLGWGFFLFALQSFIFWLFGLSFIVIIPTILFSLVNFYQTIKDNLRIKD
ncbi:MAG: hypothetical protein K2L05_09060 [Muribaculaceae bacterium]|nr:hypothetical protein [Muribaculaceae bacterium]